MMYWISLASYVASVSGVTDFMSSRWPQAQQDQRSPYAPDEEAWPPENGGAQSWQDDGWQASDPYGYSDQRSSAQGSA